MVVKMDTVCPWCKYTCTNATEVFSDTDKAPNNGDLSLCLGCGEWSVFDSFWVGGLRKPRIEEFMELADNPDCRQAREAWVMMKMEERGQCRGNQQ